MGVLPSQCEYALGLEKKRKRVRRQQNASVSGLNMEVQ